MSKEKPIIRRFCNWAYQIPTDDKKASGINKCKFREIEYKWGLFACYYCNHPDQNTDGACPPLVEFRKKQAELMQKQNTGLDFG